MGTKYYVRVSAHTTAGYLLWAAFTHHYTFDYRPGDVYACVADIGWITGHSYIVYGTSAAAYSGLMALRSQVHACHIFFNIYAFINYATFNFPKSSSII